MREEEDEEKQGVRGRRTRRHMARSWRRKPWGRHLIVPCAVLYYFVRAITKLWGRHLIVPWAVLYYFIRAITKPWGRHLIVPCAVLYYFIRAITS